MLAGIQAGYKHREDNKHQLYFQIFSVWMLACILFWFVQSTKFKINCSWAAVSVNSLIQGEPFLTLKCWDLFSESKNICHCGMLNNDPCAIALLEWQTCILPLQQDMGKIPVFWLCGFWLGQFESFENLVWNIYFIYLFYKSKIHGFWSTDSYSFVVSRVFCLVW